MTRIQDWTEEELNDEQKKFMIKLLVVQEAK